VHGTIYRCRLHKELFDINPSKREGLKP